MIKALKKLGKDRVYLNIRNTTYDKLISNITLNKEKLKPFPLKSGLRQGYSPLFIVLKLPARAIMQEKVIKGIQIGKEEVKLSQYPYL
jgi:hypothetical protein